MKRICCTVVAALMLLLIGAETVPADRSHRGGHHSGWDWLPFWFGVTAIATLPYYYPRDPPQTVIIQPPAPPPTPDTVYIQPAPPPVSSVVQIYWYYCQNPMGYYPYVKECSTGWMKVVPKVPQSVLPPSPEPPDLEK
ncbi:MAG: hypothetical protein PHY09_04840 [Desulfuromonadaceae bacterium]|nr:hypothetical protein [Desulfuromonadaceae bacterium]MDD5104686.1 hypothetical protein [Desulfuromonadaceae bacterium]